MGTRPLRPRTPPDADARVTALLEFAAVSFVRARRAFTWRLLPDVGFWDTAIFQAAPPGAGAHPPDRLPDLQPAGLAVDHAPAARQPGVRDRTCSTAVHAARSPWGWRSSWPGRWGRAALPAAAAALTCGLMVAFWRTAGRADPHPLHVLMALVVISLLLAWDRGRRPRLLVLAALVFALGLGNHMLMAMLAPGVGIYVITARPSILREPRTVRRERARPRRRPRRLRVRAAPRGREPGDPLRLRPHHPRAVPALRAGAGLRGVNGVLQHGGTRDRAAASWASSGSSWASR